MKTTPINHTGGGYKPEPYKKVRNKIKKAKLFTVNPPSLVGAWLSLKNNNYTIETALCEFIDNILNFNSNSKATISIEWYISRKHPNKNILKIKDNAEGIPVDILQVVFTLVVSPLTLRKFPLVIIDTHNLFSMIFRNLSCSPKTISKIELSLNDIVLEKVFEFLRISFFNCFSIQITFRGKNKT